MRRIESSLDKPALSTDQVHISLLQRTEVYWRLWQEVLQLETEIKQKEEQINT